MQTKGVNIEALREINKVKFYRYDVESTASTREIYDKGSQSLLFEAYSDKPVGTFSAKCETMSLTDSWVKKLFDNTDGTLTHIIMDSVVSNIAQSAFGFSTKALQYDYNYMFKGTTSFSHKFTCYLQVVDDFQKDVARPLYNLIRFVLPRETKEISEVEFFKIADEKVTEFVNDKTDGNGAMGAVVNVAKDVAGWLWAQGKHYFGGVSGLKPPPQLDQKTALKVVIGDYIVLENVIIDSVDFTLPFLTYEGGLFDRVGLDITIKGTRNMSIKTYDWLYRISRLNFGSDGTPKERKRSLNEQFKVTPAPMPNANPYKNSDTKFVDTISNNSSNLT